MLWFILCFIAAPVSFWGGLLLGDPGWSVVIFVGFLIAIAKC